MSLETGSIDPRAQQLHEIVEGFLQAVDAGQTPDREQLLAQHPTLADSLRAFFANHDRMKQSAEPATVAPPGEASAVAPLGKVRCFGDYELLAEMARGGMGVVYKARQISLNRIVALKMILSGQLASPQDVQRFRSEAEAAANLDHPNIVPIYEVGQHDGQHYFSMKMIDGGNLAQHMTRFQSDARAAARLSALTARAVHYAHQRGILHRDLKPGNILLDANGEPHVTDFGLAKRIDGGGNLTQTGAIVGTPSYMAPEQGRGEKGLSTAVDGYSLGAILYELLTGQPPFLAETPLDTILQMLERDPTPPRRLNPRADRDLETICLKCLEKDGARRYESAAALAADLERWLAGETIRARRSTAWERAVKWAKRRPALAALLLVSALSMLSLLVLAAFLWQNAEKRAQMVQNLQTAQHDLDAAKQAQSRTIAQTQAVEKRARSILYVADMQLAHAAGKADNVQTLLSLLERHRPPPGQEDLCGFEWHYLWRLCHGERLSWRAHPVAAGAPSMEEPAPVLLAFSPDGKTLASARLDNQLKWWDSATGRQNRALSLTDPIISLEFASDGKSLRLVVLAKADAKAAKASNKLLQDFVDGKAKLREILPPSFALRNVSADGRLAEGATPCELAQLPSSLGMDAVLNGRPEGTARALPSFIILKRQVISPMCMALSADRKTLALGGYSEPRTKIPGRMGESVVVLWDLNADKERGILKGHDGWITILAFAPDGRTLASTGHDKTLRLWDVAAARERTVLKDQAALIRSLAFSADGKVLAFGGDDGVLKLLDVATGQIRTSRLGHLSPVASVALSPDGRTVASAGLDGVIKLWDASATPSPTRISLKIQPLALRPLRNGNIAVVDRGGMVRIFDPFTGREQPSNHVGKGLQTLSYGAIAPDGTKAAVVDEVTGIVLAASTSGEELHRLPKADCPNLALAFSSDGKILAVGRGWMGNPLAPAQCGEIALWNLSTGKQLTTLKGHSDYVPVLAFSPNGQTLASGSGDGTAKLWDVATGKELRTIRLRGKAVSAVAFSPDGTKLAVANGGTLSIRDAATDEEFHSISLFSHRVAEMAFSPDGRRLATAGGLQLGSTKGGGAKLWDLTSGQELLTLGGPTDIISHIAFSLDGKRLMASRSAGGFQVAVGGPLFSEETLLIWDTSAPGASGSK